MSEKQINKYKSIIEEHAAAEHQKIIRTFLLISEVQPFRARLKLAWQILTRWHLKNYTGE